MKVFPLLNLLLKRLLGLLEGEGRGAGWIWCSLCPVPQHQQALPAHAACLPLITAGDVLVQEVVCNPAAACHCCLVVTHPGCCWRSSIAGSSGSPGVKCPAMQASSQTRWFTFLSLLFRVSCAEVVIKVVTDKIALFPFLSCVLPNECIHSR